MRGTNKQKWNHIAPWERKHDRAVTSVAMREGMKGSCWVYLFIADAFPSIFWWRKSPVELCLTQMCPLCSWDDGGARQIRNRLQEARKFDWNVTLIHKIWDSLLTFAWGRRMEELFGLTSAGVHLLSNNITMSRARGVISSSEVNYNNVHYM